MNRLGASSPTKALRRGGGSGGHVSDVVDVRENKSTNPATMAMHRLTMSLGSSRSSNCCCHFSRRMDSIISFRRDGAAVLLVLSSLLFPVAHKTNRLKRTAGEIHCVRGSEHRSRKKKEQQDVRCPHGSLGTWLDDGRRKLAQWIHTAQCASGSTTKQLLRIVVAVFVVKGQMTPDLLPH